MQAPTPKKSTAEKALSINLNRPLYGSLAEIGAGQEVARWFFKVGGAAGTIAKAMSAYDMTFSDDIYGREDSGRYVVESRVRRMLDYEYNLLESRLTEEQNNENYFFAFADTVAAKSYKYQGDCHGWMGLKFQHSPTEKPSQVILHVRMLDQTNLHQQEALGILGVNLTYACYHMIGNTEDFLTSLLDGDLENRIEINVVHFEGPLFQEVDPVESNLLLVHLGLCKTILIPENGYVSHLAEEFYKKQVIIHRGTFDPPLQTDIDILKSARDQYCGEKTEDFCDPYMVSEIYYNHAADKLDDLKRRVSMMRQCQQNILVTAFKRTYELTEYVALFTDNHINVVFRANKVIEVLENERLASLDRLSRIFNERTRMYIYPVNGEKIAKHLQKDPSQKLFNLSNYQPTELNIHLFNHLMSSGYIKEVTGFNEKLAMWDSQSCAALKQKDEKAWQELLACKIG
jgi:phosphopantetheine adenylyltransferase